MANLAIKGHATRGNEVIEILEMLGGINGYKVTFTETNLIYCIREGDSVIIATYPNSSITSVFTLERFLEKFPYKIGDKVLINADINDVYTIKAMTWSAYLEQVEYCIESIDGIEDNNYWLACEMERYLEQKEETMEDYGTLVQIDLTRKLCVADEVEVILGDYEFVLKDGKTYFVKKKPQYPKTYKECCDALGLNPMDNDAQGYKGDLIIRFQELLIARDVYWKIAGEEMGLDNPWEPDWDKSSQFKAVIICRSNNIIKYGYAALNAILAFPTAEMRDAFYGNFKDLIEECKEFL